VDLHWQGNDLNAIVDVGFFNTHAFPLFSCRFTNKCCIFPLEMILSISLHQYHHQLERLHSSMLIHLHRVLIHLCYPFHQVVLRAITIGSNAGLSAVPQPSHCLASSVDGAVTVYINRFYTNGICITCVCSSFFLWLIVQHFHQLYNYYNFPFSTHASLSIALLIQALRKSTTINHAHHISYFKTC